MNIESVGKKFKGNGGIYECIAFSEKPSIIMKNLDTGEKISFATDSLLAKDFEEILEEEKKIPEKLNIELNSGDENKVNFYRATNLECELAFKINSIIDFLKSKGE